MEPIDWDSVFVDMAHAAAIRSPVPPTLPKTASVLVIDNPRRVVITCVNGVLTPDNLDEYGRVCLGLNPHLADSWGEWFSGALDVLKCDYIKIGPAAEVRSPIAAVVCASMCGAPVAGATVYCSHQPCDFCTAVFAREKVARVVYDTGAGNICSFRVGRILQFHR